jgi:hypothetical protein
MAGSYRSRYNCRVVLTHESMTLRRIFHGSMVWLWSCFEVSVQLATLTIYEPFHSRDQIKLQGGKEYLMRAHFGLPSVESEEQEGRPPIAVRFEIPYFTTSGIQVSFFSL